MSDSPGLMGRIRGALFDPAAEAEQKQRERDLTRARRYPQLQPEQVRPLEGAPGRFVVDDERLAELLPVASDPEAFFIIGWLEVDGQIRYLRPPTNGPASMATWQLRRDVERREAEQSRRDEAKALAATPLRLLTVDVLEGPLPTPRQAFETFTRLNGELWVDDDGHLQAGWRAAATASDSYSQPALLGAARVLFAAEQLVVSHLVNGVPLPDSPITPGGAVAVPKPAAKRKAS